MSMKRVSLFLIALLAVFVSEASAVLVGDYDIANVVGATTQWVDGAGNVVLLGPATALNFQTTPDVTPNANNIAVTGATGDFATLLGTTGTIKDFSFIGAGSAAFPAPVLGAWESIGGLTVDLTAITGVFKVCQTGCDAASGQN